MNNNAVANIFDFDQIPSINMFNNMSQKPDNTEKVPEKQRSCTVNYTISLQKKDNHQAQFNTTNPKTYSII